MTNDERAAKLITIRGLLAKAEATEFPEEARLFTEKAQDLMTKYALSEHELREFDDPSVRDEVVTRDIKVFAPHTLAKGSLFSAVAHSNGSRIVFGASDIKYHKVEYTRGDGTTGWRHEELPPTERYRVIHVTGFSKDIDNAEMLYTSLLVQSTKELLHTTCPDWVNRRTWNKSFLFGYASEIEVRLSARRQAVARETVIVRDGQESSLLPVLASRDAQVKTAYEQTYKGQRLSSTKFGRTSVTGFSHGQAAGTRANVGDPGIGGRKALGR